MCDKKKTYSNYLAMLYQIQTLQNLERNGKNGLQIRAKILGGGRAFLWMWICGMIQSFDKNEGKNAKTVKMAGDSDEIQVGYIAFTSYRYKY